MLTGLIRISDETPAGNIGIEYVTIRTKASRALCNNSQKAMGRVPVADTIGGKKRGFYIMVGPVILC